MLFKRAGSPFFYADYRNAVGQRIKRSTETTDHKEAQALEAKWRLEAREERLWGKQPSRSFDELLLRYFKAVEGEKRSVVRDAYSAKPLRAFFTGRELQTLKRADVRSYIDKRKGQGVKGATINREIGLLSSAINYARREWDWEIQNPAEAMRLKEGEGRRRFATVEQAAALIRAAERHKWAPYLADLIRLALNTGCRRGELLGLEWSRIDLEAKTLRLGGKDTKNGKARLVPLNNEACLSLQSRFSYREAHCPESPWVFTTKGGVRLNTVQSSWEAVLREVGLEDFHFHDLRHTCGSWLVQAGVPLFDVKEVLGHSTIRMTERYAHFAPENVRAAVDRLPGVPNLSQLNTAEGGTALSG